MENQIEYAKIIERKFNENNFGFTMKELEQSTIFSFPMPAKNAPGINLKIKVGKKYGHVKIFTYISSNIDHSKRQAVLELINALHNRFRYVTFSIEEDDSLCASYEFELFGEDEDVIEKQVIKTIFIVNEIIDLCIPEIMMNIWETK